MLYASVCQVTEGQYRVNKKKYSTKGYHYDPGDPYNPGAMGFVSLVIPGVGQILSGESVRGFGFIGALIGLNIIKYRSYWNPESGSGNNMNTLKAVRYMKIGLHAWSLADAIHVAKINNMAFRNESKTEAYLQILPYLGSDDYFMHSENVMGGLTVLINF